MYLNREWQSTWRYLIVYTVARELKRTAPSPHLAEHERANKIHNFINCPHTTSQATCTLKHLHWSRWIAEWDIQGFEDVCFKNKLASEQASEVYTLQSFLCFKNTRKSVSLSLKWQHKHHPIYKIIEVAFTGSHSLQIFSFCSTQLQFFYLPSCPQ